MKWILVYKDFQGQVRHSTFYFEDSAKDLLEVFCRMGVTEFKVIEPLKKGN